MSVPELLTVRGLAVRYRDAVRPALSDLDLDLAAGECVAVTGPSGCGKSTLCRALLDLLPAGTECGGRILWRGDDVNRDRARWHALRGRGLGLVLQDHRHALDPVRRVGDQVAEVVGIHRPRLGRAERARAALALFERVRLTPAAGFVARYPHQLSGGQRQRVNLAAALAAAPAVLLADEPTTALDLPVQRGIMRLLRSLVRDDGLAVLLVTHDEDLVPLVADRVITLGEAEKPPPSPPPGGGASALPAAGRLEVRDLVVAVDGEGGRHDLVHGVSLDVPCGRAVGVVGESGAGKTTLLRALAGWITPRTGSVWLQGDVPAAAPDRRRAVQLVSQDAAAALDPQQTAWAAVREAARTRAGPGAADALAAQILAEVGLAVAEASRRPHALSGGQRQRAQLARALAAGPRILLADEPASSLDPALRRQLLDLLTRVRRSHGLGLLLVSHDLDLLAVRCDEIVVLLEGRVVERYEPGRHGEPRHPLARELLASAPSRLSRAAFAGSPAEPVDDPGVRTSRGCPHAPRCALAEDACRRSLPPLVELPDGRWLRCPPSTPRAR